MKTWSTRVERGMTCTLLLVGVFSTRTSAQVAGERSEGVIAAAESVKRLLLEGETSDGWLALAEVLRSRGIDEGTPTDAARAAAAIADSLALASAGTRRPVAERAGAGGARPVPWTRAYSSAAEPTPLAPVRGRWDMAGLSAILALALGWGLGARFSRRRTGARSPWVRTLRSGQLRRSLHRRGAPTACRDAVRLLARLRARGAA